MLKDITLGQFFPGFSPVHRLDPRIKLILTVAYVVMLFLANNLVGLAFGILFFLGAYFLARIPLKMMLKGLKPVLPIILFTSVLNMFFITGDPLFSWWIITLVCLDRRAQKNERTLSSASNSETEISGSDKNKTKQNKTST